MRKRPILVEFASKSDKDKIFKNLNQLKGNNEFKGISITDDYTTAEREMINEYIIKARELNSREEEDGPLYCVRGTPKNGLRIIKIKKVQPTPTPSED